jgi:hypothetical protein
MTMSTDLMFTHASLDTFLPDAKNEEDVDRLASDDRQWITLTETGQKDTVALVRRVVGRRYQVVNPDAGDITFLVHRDIEVRKNGGSLAVKAVRKPPSEGGHGPRYVSWVQMGYDGQVITHHGSHLVVLRASHKGRGPSQADEQVAHLTALAKSMTRFGKGDRVATGSMDLNGALPNRDDLQRVLDRYHLVTSAHVTGDLDPTHHGHRIDYVVARTGDKRFQFRDMQVRHGPQWNTDHDPIDVWATIR